MKSILFITSTSLATNPRLVKEVRTCVSLGHDVTIISFSFHNWSERLNNILISDLQPKARLQTIAGDKSDKLKWGLSTVCNLLARILLKFGIQNPLVLSVASSKRSLLLFIALRRQPHAFDLIVAHNPGAFLPAYWFAKMKKIKFGLDIEDYHPGESENPELNNRMELIMKKAGRSADVLTAASPLILERSISTIGSRKVKSAVINNAFSLSQQAYFQVLNECSLKLIWFSQTVGVNRGIQDVIKAMNQIDSFPIELTLIGHCSENVRSLLKSILTTTLHQLVFIGPVEENCLIKYCGQHHIGLALEKSYPINRDLCLTNKLFIYLLAGNAIVATRTSAQKKFFAEYCGIGETYTEGSISELSQILRRYYVDKERLQKDRTFSYHLAKSKLNWENEEKTFIELYQLN